VILRRAIEINSISGICLTKLDVLDGLETIRICVAYKDRNGQVLVDAPTDADSYDGLQPVYEEMPGWSESTVGAKSLDELPPLAVLREMEPEPLPDVEDAPVPEALQARADLEVAEQEPREQTSFRSLLMELDNMETGLKTDFQDLPDESETPEDESESLAEQAPRDY